MLFLLTISRAIDKFNEAIGKGVSWLVLISVLVCSINATVRYAANTSSNAFLEIQWYMFSAIFLLAAAYTLKRNEHVRIDVVTGRFSKRTQVWVDIFGFLFFLLPLTFIMVRYATPYAWTSIVSQEMSSNAGGLIVWPVKILIPIGFFLLTLQGFSELIKRFAFLRGLIDGKEFEKAPFNSSQPAAKTESSAP